MLRVDNNFHSQVVLFSQVGQASPAQQNNYSKIFDLFSRAAVWIRDFVLRLCYCRKSPPALAPPAAPLLQPIPINQPPARTGTGYNILDHSTPEPYVFAPRPFPLGDRYPLIRARFEGQIGLYYRLENAPPEQLDRLEALYQREPAERAALRAREEIAERRILGGDVYGEVYWAAQGLQHDMRGFNQRPLHIVPVDEAALGQIDINDLLVCFEEVRDDRQNYNRNDISGQIRGLIDFVNQPGNEEFQRTTRIFIQALRRPHTYDESFADRAFFLTFRNSQSHQESLQKMALVTNFLNNINGPVLPGWRPNECILYHLITVYNEKKKEEICALFAGNPPYNALPEIEARRRILEDHYSPADQIRNIQEMLGSHQFQRPVSIRAMFLWTPFNENEAFKELCHRLMGEDAAKGFLEVENLLFVGRGWRNLPEDGEVIAFFLEHMGFLTRQNPPRPVRQAPPVDIESLGHYAILVRNHMFRDITDELASLRRRLGPLQACYNDPRWIRVRHIFEIAIETTRRKIQIIEENLAPARNE